MAVICFVLSLFFAGLCIFLIKRYMKLVGEGKTNTIIDKYNKLSNPSKLVVLTIGALFALFCMTIILLPIATILMEGLFF